MTVFHTKGKTLRDGLVTSLGMRLPESFQARMAQTYPQPDWQLAVSVWIKIMIYHNC